MSIPILEACKKRKRRPKLFGFHTFGDPGCPIRPNGQFRENVRLFLQECAEIEDYNLEGMPIWCTLLVHENRSLVVPLYTIEEDVKTSPTPYCDHCRSTGIFSSHLFSQLGFVHLVFWSANFNFSESLFQLSWPLLLGFFSFLFFSFSSFRVEQPLRY